MKYFLLVAILLLSQSVYAGRIEKVDPLLEYWYNFYFDPGYNDSIKAYYTAMADSMSNDSVIYTSGFEEGSPESIVLTFIDSIPHIRTFIEYSGNGDDLNELGIIAGPIMGTVTVISVPLSLLPEIAALPTVKIIRAPVMGQFRPNYPDSDSFKVTDTVSSKPDSTK